MNIAIIYSNDNNKSTYYNKKEHLMMIKAKQNKTKNKNKTKQKTKNKQTNKQNKT